MKLTVDEMILHLVAVHNKSGLYDEPPARRFDVNFLRAVHRYCLHECPFEHISMCEDVDQGDILRKGEKWDT